LGSLNFLIGGFGDGRHLFTSLIDMNSQFGTLSEEKQEKVHAKFHLNDIKPHAIAKLLINLEAM
jgi:hypothetical protein